MSTRCTIIHAKGIHVYEETNSEDICFQFRDEAPLNEKYGDPVLNKQELKKLFNYLESKKEFNE